MAGPAPAGVVIAGEPGIGKTTLFRAVVDGAVRVKRCVLVTAGLSGGLDVPLANLADLLDPAALGVVDQLSRAQADALRVAVGLAPPTFQVDDAMVARATVNVLRALAVDGLLIAVDDEQWLDPDTRRVLGMAITWLSDAPITWLVSVRSSDVDTGLTPVLARVLTPRLTRVDLVGLDEDALRHVILGRFPALWSARLIRRILDLAAGNPYTALELARETITSGGHDAAVVHVPQSLADSLNVQLRRLAPTALAVVQAAAVTARPTRRLLRTIACVQAGDIVDSDAAVDAAMEAGILSATPPDPVIRFAHPLLREVALASLTWPRRRRLHRAVAEAIQEGAEAAGHLAAGADEPDEEMAALVEKAAADVAGRGAPARAAALAEAALALTPDPTGLPAWLRRILVLDCLEKASERERARELSAKWAMENPPEKVRGQLTFFRGLLDESQAGLELVAQSVDQFVGEPAIAAHVGALLAHLLSTTYWRDDEARDHAARAVRTARNAGVPAVLRWAAAVEADLAARRGDPAAEALLRDAVALPGWEDMWIPAYSPEMRLAWWHLRRGELSSARTLMEAVLQASEQDGREGGMAIVHAYLVRLEWAAGRWVQAEHHGLLFERYMRVASPLGIGSSVLVANLITAGRGQVDQARGSLVEGLRVAEADDDIGAIALIRGTLGQMELSIDDPAAAVGWLDRIAAPLSQHAFGEPCMITAAFDLVEGYARVGRIQDATTLLTRLQAAADQRNNTWARILAGRARAVLHLAGGDAASAANAVEPATAQAREQALPLEFGRCLLVLGTAQRRIRQRRTAANTLDEATSVFNQLGAPKWVELAGAERARLIHAAENTLTPTEQRISDLVALGRTNAEIAALLLISVKTVEGTLTRVYRKLGVRGRVDLARRGTT